MCSLGEALVLDQTQHRLLAWATGCDSVKASLAWFHFLSQLAGQLGATESQNNPQGYGRALRPQAHVHILGPHWVSESEFWGFKSSLLPLYV